MARESFGTGLLIGSILLSVSLLGASFFVSQAIDRAGERVRRVTLELQDLAGADRPPPRADAAPRARPGRPDPAQRYAISVADSPVRGSDEAPITIVEWSDFQCPFCRRVGPTLAQIEDEYGDRVRLVFKHLPLPMHPQAPAAHAAAEAAHRQGRFWAMHDRIFADPSNLSDERLLTHAEAIGLDVEQFQRDFASPEVRSRIEADKAQASQLGVSGTPAFFINGRFLSGAQPYAAFKKLIDEELQRAS